MKQNILIIGATSGIAEAVARRYAEQGACLYLVARNGEKLKAVADDLKARGAQSVDSFIMDANETAKLTPMLDAAWQALGTVHVVLVAHGTLPDQQRTQTDIPYALEEFRTNGESVIACLTGLAQKFEAQGSGTIAVIGSVAGDRGRASNYLYGAAKAAIESFASGLRARLFKRGVKVLLIKPGFVATPMTAELNLPEKLTASADQVALDIVKALVAGKSDLYTPWFWRWIMFIIRNIPTCLFQRMSL